MSDIKKLSKITGISEDAVRKRMKAWNCPITKSKKLNKIDFLFLQFKGSPAPNRKLNIDLKLWIAELYRCDVNVKEIAMLTDIHLKTVYSEVKEYKINNGVIIPSITNAITY